MKLQRIYIDTSVIGGCFDDEFSFWSNSLLRDLETGRFKPVLSEVVSVEIQQAPVDVQEKYHEILSYHAEVVSVDDEALTLLQAYQRHDILSLKFRNDLLHIALATTADVDLVVSWNFKHIVRFDKIRLFNAVNIEQGYRPIEIYSPREVTGYEKS